MHRTDMPRLDFTPTKRTRPSVWLGAVVILTIIALAWLGPPLAYHFLPPSVTGEDARLAAALGVRAGHAVGEVGAGRGRLATAMARRISPGVLYATEMDARLLEDLRALDAPNINVKQSTASRTGLRPACCDAVYMRNVYHHIGDPSAFNAELRRVLRQGGRLAVIDFAPGSIPHLRKAPQGTAPNRMGHGVAATETARELEAAGFAVERVDPDWGGWMYLVVARATH